MPQNLTFDPTKVKTGDRMVFLYSNKSDKNLSVSFIPVWCTVTKKTETIKTIDAIRRKRRFFFLLDLETALPGDVRELEVTHMAHLFTDLDSLKSYVRSVVNTWSLNDADHNDRQKKLKGVLYEPAGDIDIDMDINDERTSEKGGR